MIDIDGVVADVRHRLHHLSGRGSWPAFFEAADRDPLLAEGAAVVTELARTSRIVWLTGRPDWLRQTTENWLDQHGLPDGELYMRASHDRRPARLFKVSVLRRLRDAASQDPIVAIVDDDPEVVDALRDAGFPAVLADWVPRDDATGATLRDAQEHLGRT